MIRFDRRYPTWLSAVCLWAFVLGTPLRAAAHPDLEQGKRLATQLEFEAALEAFQRAIESHTLTRQELRELLHERVLLLHGLSRSEERDADLRWLVAIAADLQFDLRAPPDLVARYRALQQESTAPMGVELHVQVSGSLEATATLTGTVPDGAHARIWLRERGGRYRAEESASLWQVAIPGRELELYAEGLALGAVPVAEAYSARAPLRIKVPDGEPQAAVLPNTRAPKAPEEPAHESWARRHRGLLIAGSVAIVAVALTSAVLLTRREGGEDKTSVAPTVAF